MSDYKPCIIIPGFGQSKAELFDENGNSKNVWPLSVDVKSLARAMALPYVKTVLSGKDKGFTDTAYKLYCECFEPFAFDDTGSLKHDLRAVTHPYPLSECRVRVKNFIRRLVPVEGLIDTVGEENVFFFAYNAFEDPYRTAAELDEYIAFVKNRTKSEKVNLLSFSMGGSIAVAYFDLFADKDDIDRVMFVVSALSGSKLNSDIMTRNIDKNEGYSLLKFVTNEDTVKDFKKILSLMKHEIRHKLLYRSLDAVVDTVLANSPGMWGLVTPEDYVSLSQKYLKDKPELKAKADRFYKAKLNVRKIIAERQRRGVKFFSCLGYGLQMMPLSNSKTISSDGILQVSSPSLGAVAAPLGETLDRENSEYISPDKTIDASTAFLKDTTWFIKNAAHSKISRNEKVSELVRRALSDESFVDVYSDEKFGRFFEA